MAHRPIKDIKGDIDKLIERALSKEGDDAIKLKEINRALSASCMELRLAVAEKLDASMRPAPAGPPRAAPPATSTRPSPGPGFASSVKDDDD